MKTISRPDESRAITEFFGLAARGASGLLIDGEPGIGKTTLWLSALDQARDAGFVVLSGRAGPAEVKLAYAVLADLLGGVPQAVLDDLPEVQRSAVDAVLSRSAPAGSATDEHVVGAAVLGILERLAADNPVLVAIDDVQWLDASSVVVLAFAARRLRGRVGILGTLRNDAVSTESASWLQLAHPDSLNRIRMRPLSLGGLHSLISTRLGLKLSRPTMARISDVSGGNPLYALELARAMSEHSGATMELPESLKSLVRTRIGQMDDDVRDVLLATASAADPTVELLARACDSTTSRIVELLERAETHSVLRIEGNRVWFTHPLLASGVYDEATPAQRRAMHRRLADVVEATELRARHLALAATSADEATLAALDEAAGTASARGAPSAAAELLDLAIALGGDSRSRRLRAAEQHFRAGSLDDAHVRLDSVIDSLPPGALRGVALMLLGAVLGYGDQFAEAVAALAQSVDEAREVPALQVQALLLLTPAVGLAGRMDQSVDYARQTVACADGSGMPSLRSQALAMWVNVSFMYGLGVDHAALRTALELDDTTIPAHPTFSAPAIDAVIAGLTGNLPEAREKMRVIRRRCEDRGGEVDLMWVAEHATMIDIWLGRYGDAAITADEASVRAELIGGQLVRISAASRQAAVAAYTGQVDAARLAARGAIEWATDSGRVFMAAPPAIALGFLEVSLGRYVEALAVLEPLLASFDAEHDTEIIVGGFLPDAMEALVAVGRIDEAEPLVVALETNGARLDRAWMRAVGARGRAQVLAARGDVAGAEQSALLAMTHHEHLPMPFERARTQLLLGQLQRRLRKKDAGATLRQSLDTFEEIGAPLWAAKARAEVSRTNVGWSRDAGLTPSEQRIAELAAEGMSNRDIAASVFVSLKTVEANLGRVYRKLGIRSRAELGRRLDRG